MVYHHLSLCPLNPKHLRCQALPLSLEFLRLPSAESISRACHSSGHVPFPSFICPFPPSALVHLVIYWAPSCCGELGYDKRGKVGQKRNWGGRGHNNNNTYLDPVKIGPLWKQFHYEVKKPKDGSLIINSLEWTPGVYLFALMKMTRSEHFHAKFRKHITREDARTVWLF